MLAWLRALVQRGFHCEVGWLGLGAAFSWTVLLIWQNLGLFHLFCFLLAPSLPVWHFVCVPSLPSVPVPFLLCLTPGFLPGGQADRRTRFGSGGSGEGRGWAGMAARRPLPAQGLALRGLGCCWVCCADGFYLVPPLALLCCALLALVSSWRSP